MPGQGGVDMLDLDCKQHLLPKVHAKQSKEPKMKKCTIQA